MATVPSPPLPPLPNTHISRGGRSHLGSWISPSLPLSFFPSPLSLYLPLSISTPSIPISIPSTSLSTLPLLVGLGIELRTSHMPVSVSLLCHTPNHLVSSFQLNPARTRVLSMVSRHTPSHDKVQDRPRRCVF